MLEVRQMKDSTFGVYDTEQGDFVQTIGGRIMTRNTLARANELRQRLEMERQSKNVGRGVNVMGMNFHVYKGLKRDLAITVGLIVLLLVLKVAS